MMGGRVLGMVYIIVIFLVRVVVVFEVKFFLCVLFGFRRCIWILISFGRIWRW